MATRLCDLPDKAVAEIMSWLPPECLVQCKCVLNSWRVLIDALVKSRWFVAKHLHNFGSRPSPFLFVTGENWEPGSPPGHTVRRNLLLSSHTDERKRVRFDVEELSSVSQPIRKQVSYASFHCNGVIVQTHKETNKITLCNPATREFKHLDPSSSCFSWSGFKTLTAGLGYDPVSGVYKAVRVAILPGRDGESVSFGAEVCTLGTTENPCWREIRMMNIGNNPRAYAGREVYHGGFFYWVLRCENTVPPDERMVISFDVHEEEFRAVPLPSGVVDSPMEFDTEAMDTDGQYRATRVRMALGLYIRNHSPTLLRYVFSTVPVEADVPRGVDMWTMNTTASSSRGGREVFSSWVREHPSFFPPLKRFHVKAIWNSDELVLGACLMSQTVLYNLRTQKVRTMQLHNHNQGDFLHTDVSPYVKSLVSFHVYSS